MQSKCDFAIGDGIKTGLLTTKSSWTAEEDSYLGAYIGTQMEITENITFLIEYQHTAAAGTIGASMAVGFYPTAEFSILPAYNVLLLLIYLTNCSCFAKILIDCFDGDLIIENRAYPRLDHERIKIKTEISAHDNAWGCDFSPACFSIKKKQ